MIIIRTIVGNELERGERKDEKVKLHYNDRRYESSRIINDGGG